MNRKTFIFLCIVTVLLTAVIVAGVMALYSGVDAGSANGRDGRRTEKTASAAKPDRKDAAAKNSDAVGKDSAKGTAADEAGAKDGNRGTDADDETEGKRKAADSGTESSDRTALTTSGKNSEADAKSGTGGEATPESKADLKPLEFKVKNCGTGKQNILRQNADNSLCLIDHTGKQLWKLSIPDRICGTVAQVDCYNNGKIQFMMAAGKKLYVIDRLGRFVKGFPRDIPGQVKSGPVKVTSKGKNYWRFDTEKDKLFYDLSLNRFSTKLK